MVTSGNHIPQFWSPPPCPSIGPVVSAQSSSFGIASFLLLGLKGTLFVHYSRKQPKNTELNGHYELQKSQHITPSKSLH